ncbi:hypothetical protein FDZ74_00880 [bacterium]|nr:MAG: hypothetical protein FDZ74_00880 [bacterium]
MNRRLRRLIPPGIGILAAALLSALYLGIVSWAESPQHALDLFWEDRWLVIPILLGFGVQAGLYTVLKMRLHIPELPARPGDLDGRNGSGASVGAGGATSTVAMVACCVHHVADALPILGLTAAATFLGKYQTVFLAVGLATNLIGVGVILRIILRDRKVSLTHREISMTGSEEA